MKFIRPCVSVGAGCVFLLLGASGALGQVLNDELMPGQWLAQAEYSRLSALLDGQLLDDEQSPVRHSGDDAGSWGRSQSRLSWLPENSPWNLQWSVFTDSQIHIDGGGGDAVRRINNGGTGTPGTAYSFSAESLQYRRLGMAVSRIVDAGISGRWMLGGSVFVVDKFKSINAQGVLREGAAGALGLQGSLTQNHLGGTSPFISPDKVLGWGAGFDVSGLWGDPNTNYLRASIRDLGPAIELKHVLATTKNVNTNTLSYDSDGYVLFAPAIMGAYSSQNAKFRVKPELGLEAGYRYSAEQRWVSGLIWHGARKEINVRLQQAVSGHRVELGVHALANMPASVSLVAYGTRWGFSWRGDQLSPSKARIWSLTGHFIF